MIEINLIEKKQPMQMPVVAGVNLGSIYIPGIILALLINFFGVPAAEKFLIKDLKAERELNKKLSEKYRQLAKEMSTSGQMESQIKHFQAQEAKLNSRMEVVKEVIKLKKNPMKVLHYISKFIPEDVWLTEVDLKNDELKITGESNTYANIGQLLQSLQSSVFFRSGDPQISDTKTKEDPATGERFEAFEITGKINRYE